MTQTIVNSPVETKNPSSRTPIDIKQGDRASRVWLKGEHGESLNLADDIYKKCFFADRFGHILGQMAQHRQQFSEEYACLTKQIQTWIQEHTDSLIVDKTGLVGKPEVSSSGKVHFRFVVIKNANDIDWLNDPLEIELMEFEEKLWKDPSFQIIRINSILLPNSESND